MGVGGRRGGGVLNFCVNFKKWQCRMALSLHHSQVPCQMYDIFM